ncbi:MAG: hypothetical protein ACXWB2_06715 [Acidimicrobiales bacterium]
MVLVPGNGLIGNVAVALAMLVLLTLLVRNFWRTAQQPDDRDGHEHRGGPPRR